MAHELPTVIRSRTHRWMVTGFPLGGALLLAGLILRMGPAPAESSQPSARQSTPRAQAEPSKSWPESHFIATEIPPRPESVPASDAAVTEPLDVEFSGSDPEPVEPLFIDAPLQKSDSWLKRNLEHQAVEVDLYDDAGGDHAMGFPELISQVTKERTALVEELHDLQTRLARPVRLNSGSESLLAKVPGALEQMKQRRVDMQNRLNDQKIAAERYEPLRDWLEQRPDLDGLPIAMGAECRLNPTRAQSLQYVSQTISTMRFSAFNNERSKHTHRQLPRPTPTLGNANAAFERSVAADPEAFRSQLRKLLSSWGSVSGLTQVMQGLGEPVRKAALEVITEYHSLDATTAIAQRAVFDPSLAIRETAIVELQNREPAEFRDVLLSGLRYVWAPAAEHAARTLVAVNDQGARADLLDLADAPDPVRPVQDESGQWSVHELTRVNHLRNCLLCHAPAIEQSFARPIGVIPDPYRPIEVAYYASSSRSASVRADVTYLRQDFSVVHDVAKPGAWPEQQRFDYFVRKRELNASEASEILSSRAWSEDYPQRRAVLYALQQLDAMDTEHVVAAAE